LVATAEFAEQGAAPSPDGRWLAYSSNETGRLEVYVSPFPDVESGKVQVSSDGGRDPLWANSGSELFYLDFERRLIAARVATVPSFTVLQRETLFTNPPRTMSQRITDFYDIAPDDQRFLMGRLAAGASPDVFGVVLVQNFFEELKARVGR
jgi:Tol biopolymer transport system component